MTYQSFLIKYAEIGIKGKNRHVFEDALVRQIKLALKPCEGNFAVHKTYGRIFVECLSEYDFEEVTEALSRVFGIWGICPVAVSDVVPPKELAQKAVEFVKEAFPAGKHTFKVHTRRLDKSYPLESLELNAEIGHAVLEACPDMSVDVHDPEIMVEVELREKVYFYAQMIPGPGGLPVGIGGKTMLLLSGGIDSPVAGYMIAKRGVRIDAVYFNAPPYTSERALQKVIDLASLISGHQPEAVRFFRYMMRIAEMLAKKSNCLGLVTGESIGQVASQTLTALGVTGEVCTLPVFRPLIGFDKEEIVAVSKKIGTYETSILPYEDCCTIFVAKHPVTKPKLDVIKRHEQNLTEQIDEMVKRAIETDDMILVDQNGFRHMESQSTM